MEGLGNFQVAIVLKDLSEIFARSNTLFIWIDWANNVFMGIRIYFFISKREFPVSDTISCLEVYVKELINVDPEGNLDGLFLPRSPNISLAKSILGSNWGSMKVQGGSLVHIIAQIYPKSCYQSLKGPRKCEM